jgi:hypothetical protein
MALLAVKRINAIISNPNSTLIHKFAIVSSNPFTVCGLGTTKLVVSQYLTCPGLEISAPVDQH